MWKWRYTPQKSILNKFRNNIHQKWREVKRMKYRSALSKLWRQPDGDASKSITGCSRYQPRWREEISAVVSYQNRYTV